MSNEVVTFGCRLNAYESEVIKRNADEAGLENAIIINTCAVTSEAERQARQTIRRLHRDNPDARIIVTGCSAQINPDTYGDMPEVAQVLGNSEKMDKRYFTPGSDTKVKVNDIMSVKETASHMVASFDGKARAFIQIQNGCNHRCTFCTIPYGRGNSRSVPLGEIVSQVRLLVDNGYKEVVLTGVDITSYGEDLPGTPTFTQMLRRLLSQVPDLPRLRISSIDSVELDPDFLALVRDEKRLMPHFHISLQAGDDLILKRMKRRHLRNDTIQFCKSIREVRPDALFGADIIAGFPTETEEMFGNSLKIVDDCDLSFLHVFPFSARPGTPAAKMPQVKGDIVKDRAQRLRAKGGESLKKTFDNLVGKELMVLMEDDLKGHSESFCPVTLDAPCPANSLVKVRVIGHDGSSLNATLVDSHG